jgi:hypothetical protein
MSSKMGALIDLPFVASPDQGRIISVNSRLFAPGTAISRSGPLIWANVNLEDVR